MLGLPGLAHALDLLKHAGARPGARFVGSCPGWQPGRAPGVSTENVWANALSFLSFPWVAPAKPEKAC